MIFAFGDFTVDTDRFELKRCDVLIPMERKNFELLCFLLDQHTRAVSKDEIVAAVWPNVIVTDASLSTAIAQVRKALGDNGQTQKFIRTIRGHGFRFVAELETRAAPQPITLKDLEPEAPPERPTNRPAIAVLPFTLLGDETQQTAIAEAVPAELIATLSRLRWIKVIARASSFQFAEQSPDFHRVHTSLGATYVLTGMVEISAPSIRISVELTDTRTHEVIWSNTIAGKQDHVFELREQIARQVISALEVRIPLNEAERLTHTPSENLDAWGHYHLGLRHMQTYSRTNNLISEGHFKQAVALDPNFARARSALSYTEFQNHFQMFQSDENLHRDLALKYAEEAAALDQLDPFCLLNMARAKWLFGHVEEGLGWAERALALNPNYAFGFYNSAIFHNILCEAERADQDVLDALDLSPLDPHLQSMLGTRALAAFLKDDLEAAIGFAEQSLRAPNPHLYVYMLAAVVFHTAGDTERAQTAVANIRESNPGFGSPQFLSHYNFRDPEQKARIVSLLKEIGI